MSETFFVKPANRGATIIDPASNEALDAKGAEKPRDPYWLGLIHRGDVVEIDPPASAEPSKSKSSKD